jgi:hypothetical protein
MYEIIRDIIAFPVVLCGILLTALGQAIGGPRTKRALAEGIEKGYWEAQSELAAMSDKWRVSKPNTEFKPRYFVNDRNGARPFES